MDLKYHRKEIDNIDQQFLTLLNQRARLALSIVKVKQKLSLPVFDPEREQQILRSLKAANRGPLSDESLEKIFKVIIKENRLLEEQQGEGKE